MDETSSLSTVSSVVPSIPATIVLLKGPWRYETCSIEGAKKHSFFLSALSEIDMDAVLTTEPSC